MKIINLAVPAPIGGPLRHPEEGPFTVSDDQARRFKDAGMLDGEPEDVPEDDETAGDEPDELDAMKVEDLKTLAAGEGADLGSATRKDDIIAAIRAHRAGSGS